MGAAGVYDCNGISIEHLTLDANGPTNRNVINGIVNNYAEELSYVNDVALINITGTGLMIGVATDGTSGNSGPYSNIGFTASGANATCASINLRLNAVSALDTRGIKGLTCNGQGSTGAAIYLDGSNNSITDIYVNGFADGILVGSRNPAANNLLANVVGGLSVTNVVHISSATSTYSVCPSTSSNANVCDLTALAITAQNSSGNTIKDDLTQTTLTQSSNSTVGMYALGEIGTGYPRFTTSPNVPTWLVWPTGPTGTTCQTGSLYSCTGTVGCVSGTTTATIFGCSGNTWHKVLQ
jgi:hypothetical protein